MENYQDYQGVVLPNHKYTSPYNLLHLHLDKNDPPIPTHVPFSKIDEFSMTHGICRHWDNSGNCDKIMLNKLNNYNPINQ